MRYYWLLYGLLWAIMVFRRTPYKAVTYFVIWLWLWSRTGWGFETDKLREKENESIQKLKKMIFSGLNKPSSQLLTSKNKFINE